MDNRGAVEVLYLLGLYIGGEFVWVKPGPRELPKDVVDRLDDGKRPRLIKRREKDEEENSQPSFRWD